MATEIIERQQSALLRVFPRSRRYQANIENSRPRHRVFSENVLRRKLIIQNIGPEPIEYGGEDLRYGEGIRIAAGGNIFDDLSTWTGEVYVASGSATATDVRAREEWLEGAA